MFKVLVFDMRGSGQSDKKRPYTHAQWVQDIDELRSV
jgi:proline iminopeptidase